MASYDSDSSSDADLDVQTNVTLGYVTQESTGDDISHVGGHPTWLDANTKPSASLSKCKVCNDHMSLLLQLQADLQSQFPNDERRLFVWCCRKKQCSKKPGSIRAFREVKKARTTRKAQPQDKQEKSSSSPPPQQNLGTKLFGGSPAPNTTTNTNPFATSSNPFSTTPSSQSNSFSELAAKPPQPPTHTLAEKLTISDPQPTPTSTTPPSPWPPEASFPPPFTHFYLDAEAEYLDSNPAPDTAGPSSSTNHPTLDDDPPTNSTSEKDLYESPHDKTFDIFTRTLSENPDQILRYDFSGVPLLYSSTDATSTHFTLPGHSGNSSSKIKTVGPVKGIPNCQYCGAARVFECQLVPNLIYELEKDNEEAMKIDGKEGMEWGTIIVGTCVRNCGVEAQIVFREEWVGVQWEEGGVELKQKK